MAATPSTSAPLELPTDLTPGSPSSDSAFRTSETVAAASKCHLLELQAELRNDIYELAFSSDTAATQDVDLLKAAPPSKSLVLACKQVHSEANAMYKAAYHEYWTTTKFKFVAHRPRGEENHADAALLECLKLRSEDVDHIRELSITQFKSATCNQIFVWWELIDPRGVWMRRSIASENTLDLAGPLRVMGLATQFFLIL